jgi:hypothetical protein
LRPTKQKSESVLIGKYGGKGGIGDLNSPMPLDSIKEEGYQNRDRSNSVSRSPFNSKTREVIDAVEEKVCLYKKDEKISKFLDNNKDSLESSLFNNSN